MFMNVYAGDEEEEYRDDAVNNTDDNLIRAHQLEHCWVTFLIRTSNRLIS